MNYREIEQSFINYIRHTTPKDRILHRNKNDIRLEKNYIYVEVHHIIPQAIGGTNEKENLITVLPEEHIFLHKLRYKIYKLRCDMLAVRICLNGFDNPCDSKIIEKNMRLTKAILSGYAFIRTFSAKFRKEIGWHTEEGRKSISISRTGTFPAVDKFGNSIGCVSVNDPRYLAGEIFHHSKGKSLTDEHIAKIREKNIGILNGNSKGYTDKDLVESALAFVEKYGFIPTKPKWIEFSIKNNLPYIKSFKEFRFNGKGFNGIIEELEKITGLPFLGKTHKIRMFKLDQN